MLKCILDRKKFFIFAPTSRVRVPRIRNSPQWWRCPSLQLRTTFVRLPFHSSSWLIPLTRLPSTSATKSSSLWRRRCRFGNLWVFAMNLSQILEIYPILLKVPQADCNIESKIGGNFVCIFRSDPHTHGISDIVKICLFSSLVNYTSGNSGVNNQCHQLSWPECDLCF